jgi:hypothetical protein
VIWVAADAPDGIKPVCIDPTESTDVFIDIEAFCRHKSRIACFLMMNGVSNTRPLKHMQKDFGDTDRGASFWLNLCASVKVYSMLITAFKKPSWKQSKSDQ